MTTLKAPLLAGTVLEEQHALESAAVQDGIKRYREQSALAVKRGEGAGLKSCERLMLHWFEVLNGVFYNEREECLAGIPGRLRQITGPFLLAPLNPDDPKGRPLISHEEMSVIVMHEAINACLNSPTGVRRTTLACSIGRAVFGEINLKLFRRDKSARAALHDLDRRFKRRTPQRVNWWANKNLDNAVHDTVAKAHIGGFLLEKLITFASAADYDWNNFKKALVPAFVVETRWESKRRQATYVRLTDEAWEVIDAGDNVRSLMRPRYLPMIVPPYTWAMDPKTGKTIEGGYAKIRTPFFSKPTQAQKRALEKSDLSRVYDCLNAVNAPGWRVKHKLLAVADQIWKSGGNTLGIPRANPQPMPPRVSEDDPKALKEAKARRAEIWKQNVADRSSRAHFLRKLHIAETFRHRPAIYYPHQLDFRGRAYPIPPHLNHQGDDLAIGLLEFSKGKEPGEHGLRRLKIHAANCYGLSKLKFADRIQWADDHMRAIQASAVDPLDTEFWRHADESRPGKCDGTPWTFLAACMGLTEPDSAAHIPIQIDGTCNGLQHYAALGRDPVGAAAVNLKPGDAPADVYQLVADEVRRMVQSDARSSQRLMKFRVWPETGAPYTVEVPASKLAARVADLVGRRVVKQPVMTSVYGVTPVGANTQTRNRLADLGLTGQELHQCSQYLGGVTLRGIGQVCSAAREIMTWLQACARIVAEAGKPVSWVTPLGLPVVQPYRKFRTQHVDTLVGRLFLQKDEEDIDVALGDQVDGTAPNYVHSLDATHMFMTAEACHRADVTFAATHDGYKTHAATGDHLARFTGNTFVELHSAPLITNLAEQLQSLVPDQSLPSPPAPGDFDIMEVLKSQYMFS